MANELAKVLWYYKLIPTISEPIQKIVCPFHNDINPSMKVDLLEGRWFCFGCGKSGYAKDFVYEVESKYNNLNDLQSYRKYLDILKSKEVSDIKLNATKMYKRRKSDKELYDISYDYYHGLSKIDWENTKITEAILAGKYMVNRGFSLELLTTIKAKITYNNQYSIIFPMLDNGKFRGWVCRTTDKEIEKKRKYLYNKGFSRATTLVGNYGKKDYVIVVEGYMDRLKFVQFGEENVVAILGWKMSQNQIQKLKAKGITHVISALDNDECGIKGTKFLRTEFKVTRWCYLKGIKDPGEMDLSTFNKMYNKTMLKYNEGVSNGIIKRDKERRKKVRPKQR